MEMSKRQATQFLKQYSKHVLLTTKNILEENDSVLHDAQDITLFDNGIIIHTDRVFLWLADDDCYGDITDYYDDVEFELLLIVMKVINREGYLLEDVADINDCAWNRGEALVTIRLRCGSIHYRIFKDGDIAEEAAFDYLTADTSQWKSEVATDMTTRGLSDWASDILIGDGWAHILSHGGKGSHETVKADGHTYSYVCVG